jgi:NAD(P)-dependent dehydrogenase (short-subunit alcohol dehydrogenase family)
MPEIDMCNLCALVTSGSGAIGRTIAESFAAFAATVDAT